MSVALTGLPDWPYILGVPDVTGLIRCQLEDFQVQEIPSIEPCGEGSHLWLELEKRGANTHWVADQLSAASGVSLRDIGYAGLKDRHGVTSQWFSLSLQEARNADWNTWNISGVSILQALRHNRKLKIGTLKGNRFRIVVRELRGNIGGLERRLESLVRVGLPNYFGPQRFGFNGGNIQRGIHWLEHGGRLPRNKRSIYLSAVRSFLFNQFLARRIQDQTWNQIQDGEIAMLNGTHSLFACTMPDPVLTRRCDEFDIHPTGPLPGTGGKCPQRQAAQTEEQVLETHLAVVESLCRAGARADRRALRLLPGKLEWEIDSATMTLSFDLCSGSYATSVLRELVSCSDSNHISAS